VVGAWRLDLPIDVEDTSDNESDGKTGEGGSEIEISDGDGDGDSECSSTTTSSSSRLEIRLDYHYATTKGLLRLAGGNGSPLPPKYSLDF